MSIAFYTDFTELSSKFTSTFRRNNCYESISVTKRKNQEYAIWSRYLREVVEYWGAIAWNDDKDKQWNINHNRVKGPFFCGISHQMVLPEYNIRLCGPTSTSSAVEVAHRFGGISGIILRLNNRETISSYFVRIFGCEWISNHRNEEEFLFCGGQERMQVENVRIIETNAKYGKYLRPLHYFDCILSGGKIRENCAIKLTSDDLVIMMNVTHQRMYPQQYENMFPTYINRSFEAYIQNKHHIVIDLDNLRKNFDSFILLVITQMGDFNCLNLELFNLFTNMQNLEIIADGEENSIDILSVLASLMDFPTFKENNVTLRIKAKRAGQSNGRSWIFRQYQQVIITNTAMHYNLRMESSIIKSDTIDILTIKPITDTWNCPICFYGQTKSPIQNCVICGYSTNSESIVHHLKQLKLYQQIWFNQEETIQNHDKELYAWEIQNQLEIEHQITNQVEQESTETAREPRLQQKRQTLILDRYMMNIDKDFVDEVLDEVKQCEQCAYANNQNDNNCVMCGHMKEDERDSCVPFRSYMDVSDAAALKQGDMIDHRDELGRFALATIVEKKQTNLKIHYLGWSDKWDFWSDLKKELHRFAKARSISNRPAHRFKDLKKGDYIDINPTIRHSGWKSGKIQELDKESGQFEVVYTFDDEKFLYWSHLDNKQEVAEFASKTGAVNDR